MPIVPFSGPSAAPGVRVAATPADEAFNMMALAQMDSEGRFKNIDDRRERGQSAKELDNDMVDDQQLPPAKEMDIDRDINKLGRQAGTGALDRMEGQNIIKAIERGVAARGK